MSRVKCFCDGSWLRHNFFRLHDTYGVKLDLTKLAYLLITTLSERLRKQLDYNGTILCASVPVNTDPEDQWLVCKQQNFFEDILRNKCGYTVELFNIDFKGRRLLEKDRGDDSWKPKEKCVDIAIATNLLYYKDSYDIAILITGDRDFLPAIDKARKLGKRVVIASFSDSCSRELYSSYSEIIFIDDFLDQMILRSYY
jgi:hypothetical protein